MSLKEYPKPAIAIQPVYQNGGGMHFILHRREYGGVIGIVKRDTYDNTDYQLYTETPTQEVTQEELTEVLTFLRQLNAF